MSTAQEIVMKLQEALEKLDFAGARSLLHDDVMVQGPIESFQTADSYIEATKQLAAIVERIDIKKIFADGDDVCLLYDMVTSLPVATTFIAEWYQVSGNKIRSIRGVYDPLPFTRMIGR